MNQKKTHKKTKETRIGKQRQRYACSQQSIRAVFGWDEDTYHNQWLDGGLVFLESVYPAKDTSYASLHQQTKGDRGYWLWWLAEWKQEEAEWTDKWLVNWSKKQYQCQCPSCYKCMHLKAHYELWASNLVNLCLVQESFFKNYLKHIKHILK